MQKPLRVEVEVVSPRRWAKLERTLFARWDEEQRRDKDAELPPTAPSSAGRSRWLIALLAATLAVAAAFAFVLGWRGAGESAAPDRTSRITTGVSGSHLVLQGLTLDVEPESAVVIGSPSERGMLIVLDRGAIVCEVAPRSADSPLVVQAGSVQVKVVGTRFSVTRAGEQASVVVEHGVVQVAAGGRVTRVGAGEVWPPKALANVGSTPAPTAGREAALSDSARESPAAASAKSAALPPSHVPYRESAQARFEAGAALERRDPARAVELYRTLENGADSWAQHALYAHGRLEAARGHRAQARLLLERYLARFPNGPNSADARSVLDGLR